MFIILYALIGKFEFEANRWLFDTFYLSIFDILLFENLKNCLKVCYYLNDMNDEYEKSVTDTIIYKILSDRVFEDFLSTFRDSNYDD